MPPVAIGLAVVAVVSVGLQVYGAVQDNKARKAAGRASDARGRLQRLKQAREKQRGVRDARRARAETDIQGQASGTGNRSSATIQAQQGIQNQSASNASFLDVEAGFANYASRQERSASRYRGRGNNARAGAQIVETVGSAAVKGGG